MRVRYSSRAKADLNSIYTYIDSHSPRGAVNVMAAIYAAVEFIRRNPNATPRALRISDTRAMVVRHYPYRIFYRVSLSEDVVEIVHIRHTSRRPWLGEID
jgi:addiction module RelE/StbE family toxin